MPRFELVANTLGNRGQRDAQRGIIKILARLLVFGSHLDRHGDRLLAISLDFEGKPHAAVFIAEGRRLNRQHRGPLIERLIVRIDQTLRRFGDK